MGQCQSSRSPWMVGSLFGRVLSGPGDGHSTLAGWSRRSAWRPSFGWRIGGNQWTCYTASRVIRTAGGQTAPKCGPGGSKEDDTNPIQILCRSY